MIWDQKKWYLLREYMLYACSKRAHFFSLEKKSEKAVPFYYPRFDSTFSFFAIIVG